MEYSRKEHWSGFSGNGFSRSLLQGIFPTQGLNPGLPHCRGMLYQLNHQGSSEAASLISSQVMSSLHLQLLWETALEQYLFSFYHIFSPGLEYRLGSIATGWPVVLVWQGWSWALCILGYPTVLGRLVIPRAPEPLWIALILLLPNFLPIQPTDFCFLTLKINAFSWGSSFLFHEMSCPLADLSPPAQKTKLNLHPVYLVSSVSGRAAHLTWFGRSHVTFPQTSSELGGLSETGWAPFGQLIPVLSYKRSSVSSDPAGLPSAWEKCLFCFAA